MFVLVVLGTWQAVRLRSARQHMHDQERAIRGRDAEIRQAQYVSDIGAASLIAQSEAKEWRELLDRHHSSAAEDLRGFEWFYLHDQTDASLASWVGHEGKHVYHVEYAPDGRRLASAGADGTEPGSGMPSRESGS